MYKIVMVLGIMLLMSFSVAIANPIYLNVPNAGLSGFTGPYATVDITLNATKNVAIVVFSSLTNGVNTYFVSGQGIADLNVNGAYTLGLPVAESNSIFPSYTPDYKDNTPGNVSDFGNFNLSLNNKNNGFTQVATHVEFTLTKVSGTWVDENNVLTPNNAGYIAAAHISVLTPGSADFATTGFAGNGSNPVPEPTSLLLLGSGLAAIGFATSRRRK